MTCRSELRGLGAIHDELAARGGGVLAISVDEPQLSAGVVRDEGLRFPILCDTERDVLRRYGLVHAGGAPDGSDVAVPALLLVRGDGSIAWRHVARLIQDRADPADVLAAVRGL